MNATIKIDHEQIDDPAVRKAIAGLVRVSEWGNSYLVTMPLVYPSGTVVGVRIMPAQGGFWVSDFALGYREAETFEAQRSFGSHAGRLKEELGVEYTDGHELRLFAKENQIAWALRRVAYASHRVVTKVYNSAPTWDEQEISATLFQRLRKLFGDAHVQHDIHVHGASNIDWRFAAAVQLGDRRVFFDIVTPHHSSVFSAVSKFSDIRRLGEDAHPVAVVDDVAKMGKWLPLISQEAEVIEDEVSDDTLKAVVLEAA